MIVVMNRIPVKPEFAQRIEDGFAKNAPGLTELKGFQGFRLLRPLKDGDPYVVYVSCIRKRITRHTWVQSYSSKVTPIWRIWPMHSTARRPWRSMKSPMK